MSNHDKIICVFVLLGINLFTYFWLISYDVFKGSARKCIQVWKVVFCLDVVLCVVSSFIGEKRQSYPVFLVALLFSFAPILQLFRKQSGNESKASGASEDKSIGEIVRDKKTTAENFTARLRYYQNDIRLRVESRKHYSTDEALEMILFVVHADLAYRKFPEYAKNALAMLSSAIHQKLIDPNARVEQRSDTDLNGETLTAYPYLMKNGKYDLGEASALSRFIGFMLNHGADPELKDKNGNSPVDYLEKLRTEL